jgi:hypothetical protein
MNTKYGNNEHSAATDCSTDFRKLSEAVESFLWWSGYTEREGALCAASLETAYEVHQMGTKTIDRLMQALREFGHPDVQIRKPEPKRNAKRVVFEFDERSYESMEDIKRRTGCEFTMVVVRNPETGEELEIALPSMPQNAWVYRAAKERHDYENRR